MTADELGRIRRIVAAGAGLIAIGSVVAVWGWQPKGWLGGLIILIWTIGPPTWFGVEYVLFRKIGAQPPERLGELRMGQELAGKFWAGIAALLTALYALYKPPG
jgi:hypothetical protein